MPKAVPVLVGGVLLLAAAIVAPSRLLPLTALLGALLAGATAGHLLAAPGMPRVHDLGHLWGLWAYGRCVDEGVLYPLWTPYLGAGMPLFQFYGPLNFLLGLPGILAGLSSMDLWKLELFQSHVLSALSMLAAARILGVGWRAALLAAAALAFAPWRLAVFDYRGALGEANAFLFMPLVAAGTLRMLRAPTATAAVALVCGTVALVLTHLLSLLTLVFSLLPAVLLAGKQAAFRLQ